MSILITLVGVAATRFTGYYDNDAVLRPMASESQRRRICGELCASGLGGEPCGESCLDHLPQNLPPQSNASARGAETTATRHDACPVLCENQLGYPLCQCESTIQKINVDADYVQICSFFCVSYDHQINGCQRCQIYKDAVAATNTSTDNFNSRKSLGSSSTDVDWEAWCKEMCAAGDGGIACNCDILPISSQID